MASAATPSPSHPFIIVAGLPRTGTTTLTTALSQLLRAPVFDGGAASYSGAARTQRRLLTLVSHFPVRSPDDRARVVELLGELTDGYAGSSDIPGSFCVGELLECWPEARVVWTVRGREGWWGSYGALWRGVEGIEWWVGGVGGEGGAGGLLGSLGWVISPRLRRFVGFTVGMWGKVPEICRFSDDGGGDGDGEGKRGGEEDWEKNREARGKLGSVRFEGRNVFDLRNHEGLYDAHAAYIRRVVPEEKLLRFDVREGWAPLCEFLGVEVPDVPFPHEFPRKYLTEGLEVLVRRLRRRWWALVTVLSAGTGVAGWVLWRYLSRRLGRGTQTVGL
ncbi:hypothetical protein LTS18_002895 [Coniosporium uncinatum]|uniref:Uncharacterized protein n=1 Tax=Coniosporium uncinatum TaxID=93489 RepID=A0ACC3D7C6_9PEZI|nr:hypothetical protein LTS18_002895 [Coniosporium uncinatum]